MVGKRLVVVVELRDMWSMAWRNSEEQSKTSGF